MLGQQRQDGQRESRGFTGPSLRGADQIFAGENNREGAKLDRGGLRETHCLRAAHDLRREAKIFK